MASSLFSLRAWQSSRTTSFQVLFGLPLGLEPPDHSHLCSLKCHHIFFPYRPGLTSITLVALARHNNETVVDSLMRVSPRSGAANGGSVWLSLYATTSNSCCHLLSHLCRFASTISGHFVHIRVTHKTGNAQHIATPTEETRATGHRGYTWARLHSLSCLVPRFSTWRYPHSLLSAVPASAANRALSSKPVARSCWCRSLGQRTVWDRRKDGRTTDRYITQRPT